MTHPRLLMILALCLTMCSACVGLPDSGDVQVGDDRPTSSQDSGFPYDPRPPQAGEEATEIVGHFLDAMMANPTTTSVAKQFLSEEARESWHPDRQLITYDGILTPTGNEEVSVTVLNAHHLDGRGVWQGTLPADQRTLKFAMTVENGEWRIEDPPDAMIVSDEFFAARYRQASLYFLDPTARVVVPEPVFVPRGGQLSAVLMRSLLLGPGRRLQGVTRSYIPDDLSLDLTAPVSADGVAEVSLRGETAPLDAESAELMSVQIAWTLRQDPSVRRIRLTINETPVTVSGTSSDFDVDMGEEYNPVGDGSWQGLFALRDGRMVSSVGASATRVSGPFGAHDYDLATFAVDLDASRVAGVTGDRSSVVLASVDKDEQPVALDSGRTDLLKPAWDVAGRLWMLDRTPQGAVIRYWWKGRVREVTVPGVSGKAVSRFLVSRDGTRLVAVVRGARRDVVVQSRLALIGSRLRGTRAEVIHVDDGEKVRIADIAWFSPTAVALVRPITDELSQVTTFSVDGSRFVQPLEVPIELVRDDIVALVSSPAENLVTWAVAASGEPHDLSAESDPTPPGEGLKELTYVG